MSEISAVQAGGAVYKDAVNTTTAKAAAVKSVATKSEKKISADVTGISEEQTKENGKTGMGKNAAKSVVDTANDLLKTNRTSARLKYHEATKQVSIKIVDDVTQEVIKEIPPEKSIEMLEKMLEMTGILVDEKR
ncbi:MAG: flagellar protein FlaG [Lachnospiraceae bacterium]|nr:flagellar protein FlaG [Lachnospiraceae bacterium]